MTTARGLGDLRTAISHRVRATPPLKGTTYLEMYLLDNERQRLEAELGRLNHRRDRIDERLGEIGDKLRGLEAVAAQIAARNGAAICAGGSRTQPARPPRGEAPVLTENAAEHDSTAPSGANRWKQMTVGY
ncbi:MAG: hypothetical protein HY332_25740 [Chloroflexi bacterium]|nr:hypothetical protein [Chloroflexota bacterium]